jgi:hypothetical protein
MLLLLVSSVCAALARPPGPPTPPFDPGRRTRPFSPSKPDVGSFHPRRIRAHRNCTLTFTAEFKIPFFIRIGYNNPVLGDLTPGATRTAKIPPVGPGEFPVSVSNDGKDWQEIDYLIVEPARTAPTAAPPTPAGDDPAQVAIGFFIGLGIVAVVFGLGLGAWRLYLRETRRRRQRRSDEGIRYADVR